MSNPEFDYTYSIQVSKHISLLFDELARIGLISINTVMNNETGETE